VALEEEAIKVWAETHPDYAEELRRQFEEERPGLIEGWDRMSRLKEVDSEDGYRFGGIVSPEEWSALGLDGPSVYRTDDGFLVVRWVCWAEFTWRGGGRAGPRDPDPERVDAMLLVAERVSQDGQVSREVLHTSTRAGESGLWFFEVVHELA
jgi:hypothetical protein